MRYHAFIARLVCVSTIHGAIEKQMEEIGQICIPGQRLQSVKDGFKEGPGTYLMKGCIHASLAGTVVYTSTEHGLKRVEVKTTWEQGLVPSVGSVVVARITRVTQRFCKALILAVDNVLLREPFRAMLRKEDVRAKEKDQVMMYKCFRPGDMILAKVLSLGDALSYLLTTAENELGVVVATSEAGAAMIPVSWCEMQCPVTLAKEERKVAKAHARFCVIQSQT